MSTTHQFTGFAAAAVAALGIAAGVAHADPQPIPGLNPQLSAPAQGVGGYLVVFGTGWPPNTAVQVRVADVGGSPDRLSVARSDLLGDFTLPTDCGFIGHPGNVAISAQSGNPAVDGSYAAPILDYCS